MSEGQQWDLMYPEPLSFQNNLTGLVQVINANLIFWDGLRDWMACAPLSVYDTASIVILTKTAQRKQWHKWNGTLMRGFNWLSTQRMWVARFNSVTLWQKSHVNYRGSCCDWKRDGKGFSMWFCSSSQPLILQKAKPRREPTKKGAIRSYVPF